MSSIVLVLLEAHDTALSGMLTALSEGGVGGRVRRVRTRAALRAALEHERVDAIVLGPALPGCAPPAIIEDARAHAPGTPLVLVTDAPLDDACDWLAAGAAACVPAGRLDRLPGAIARAVAEAERRREEESRGRRRDAFLSRVAHQLRTPQNALLGWTALLAGKRLDEAARARALDTIARNARWEARMIEDLLDVSRIISRSLDLDRVELDLCPAVAAALDAAQKPAEEAGVELSAELDEDAGAALVDPRRLDQIVRELVANAVRATPRGGRVGVRLRREAAAREARIEVRDSGRGIRADALPRLFDSIGLELDRADPPAPAARAHHGLGVGLFIVRHLVEALSGSIVAESDGEGRGATFTVRLPVR